MNNMLPAEDKMQSFCLSGSEVIFQSREQTGNKNGYCRGDSTLGGKETYLSAHTKITQLDLASRVY